MNNSLTLTCLNYKVIINSVMESRPSIYYPGKLVASCA